MIRGNIYILLAKTWQAVARWLCHVVYGIITWSAYSLRASYMCSEFSKLLWYRIQRTFILLLVGSGTLLEAKYYSNDDIWLESQNIITWYDIMLTDQNNNCYAFHKFVFCDLSYHYFISGDCKNRRSIDCRIVTEMCVLFQLWFLDKCKYDYPRTFLMFKKNRMMKYIGDL